MPDVTKLLDQSIDHRRNLQYYVLKDWDHGKITGSECIEKILELEKLIPLSRQMLRGK